MCVLRQNYYEKFIFDTLDSYINDSPMTSADDRANNTLKNLKNAPISRIDISQKKIHPNFKDLVPVSRYV